MRILVVEDEVTLAEATRDMLLDAHYSVVGVATAGARALLLARTEHPDLALVDLHLAKGRSGAKVIHVIATLYHIPSIIVSGHRDDCRAFAKETGVLGCLTKPFTHSDLVRVVEVANAMINGRVPRVLPPNLEIYHNL